MVFAMPDSSICEVSEPSSFLKDERFLQIAKFLVLYDGSWRRDPSQRE
jgi:hypothetical protein